MPSFFVAKNVKINSSAKANQIKFKPPLSKGGVTTVTEGFVLPQTIIPD